MLIAVSSSLALYFLQCAERQDAPAEQSQPYTSEAVTYSIFYLSIFLSFNGGKKR